MRNILKMRIFEKELESGVSNVREKGRKKEKKRIPEIPGIRSDLLLITFFVAILCCSNHSFYFLFLLLFPIWLL
jgi:hypothetical protein